jgi:hypothetical protein
MRLFVTPNFPPGYFVAITLWPVGIFFNSKGWRNSPTTVRHEKIHWEQQKEMGGILFYVWYLVEYLFRLIRYRNADKAYRAISFELEAHIYSWDDQYLRTRKRYAWIKFL